MSGADDKGRFTSKDWDDYKTKKVTGRDTSGVFKSKMIHPDLDPMNITIRESRDSIGSPESNALIVGLDVTGSMGFIADAIARDGLNVLFKEIYEREPIKNPHVMFMGIGDVEGDRAPLQASQFETDIKIANQLTDIFLEHGGGANGYESYSLPWYFAALHTSIDCFEKRGKKGFLFTMGDENPTEILKASDIERFLGTGPQTDMTSEELLTMAERSYHVFHLMIEEGSHYRHHGDKVKTSWTNLMGQRAIPVSDHTKIAEIIVSTIQITNGADVDDVIGSWDGDTGLVIKSAVSGMASAGAESTGGLTEY